MKILQVTGFKNSGKTTTVDRMVGYLKSQGHTVAVIKHHHRDAVHDEATDTGKFIRSGADFTVLNTPGTVMTVENTPPDLHAQIDRFSGQVDFILIEGYKEEDFPKIFMEYSFKSGHTKLTNIGLRNVLKSFDIRYDEEYIMTWFKEWSKDE
ncbi:molybdopterin-guanine dinucleotide biosynthesis protein B [Lacicoccus alkaliphilus]|uniref:Molybdopterin-guanine dinucleotide biosynthesis protein B n=1 Tax=Lacicoccus alkaliphilus DSM 16010 TaxID=1123231 RepID=A0A1M7F5H7_9BACL|nr:molybdopterin-guanine dinucleotide biosynthesis protein B [Salinicoccus alkaliphilus]SHL98917.1 molybdopterin-guanine dinucleotide biosynthesis protein B [Salinicoccus alkaliphilus DSM 16010]